MKIVLLLVAMIGFGDFRNQIALEVAKAKIQDVSATPKVARSQCKHCKGTGRVTAGDGITIVTRECDACFDDSVQKTVGKAVGDALKVTADLAKLVPVPPSETAAMPTKYEIKFDEGSKKRILDFGATWCVNCVRMHKSNNGSAPFEVLASQGWKIGTSNDMQIQTIDIDDYPEIYERYKKSSTLPLLVLVYDGQEMARYTGFQNQKTIPQLWETRVGPQFLRNWCRTYKGEPAEVKGRTDFQHLTETYEGEQHHEGGPFKTWQLQGLTVRELRLIHSGQHNHALTPYGALK